MTWRTIGLVLAAMLACGLIAAGCGDDDDDSDQPAVTVETTTTGETTTGDLGEAQDQADESKAQALERCREAADKLSGDEREQALEVCENVLGE